MATATSRKATPTPAVLKQRRAVALERLELEKRIEPLEAAAARLDGMLKDVAAELAASFKEDFGDQGNVAVAPAKAAEFKGDMPVIVPEVWNALKPPQRERLLKLGVITIEPNYARASNGRVTVNTLTPKKVA